MSCFGVIALKSYLFIQEKIYIQITKYEYSDLLEKNEVLERDPWGVKVLETPDKKILKIFRLKRLFSSAYFYPYALRFKHNAAFLEKKGVKTVDVENIVYCMGVQRHVLSYKKVMGQPVSSAIEKSQDSKALLKKLISFVTSLHSKGIYFRSLHLGNIIMEPDGTFVLIDISDMRFFPHKLTINQRIRNWKHVLKNEFEREIIADYGWDDFINEYASCSMLTLRDKEKLRLKLKR